MLKCCPSSQKSKVLYKVILNTSFLCIPKISNLLALRWLGIMFANSAKKYSHSIQNYPCCSYLGPKCRELSLLRGNWCLIVYWESSLCTLSQVISWKDFFFHFNPLRKTFFELHCTWHLIWHGDRSGQMFLQTHLSGFLLSYLMYLSSGGRGRVKHSDSICWRLWRAGWQKTLQWWNKEWKE